MSEKWGVNMKRNIEIDQKGRLYIPKNIRELFDEQVIITYILKNEFLVRNEKDFHPEKILQSHKLPQERLKKVFRFICANSFSVNLCSGVIKIPNSILEKLTDTNCTFIFRTETKNKTLKNNL